MKKYFFLTAAITFYSYVAQAFPEMIRHHYINCTACHVSQSGGGVLTPYGRSLSNELLSSWGSADEARAFYRVNPDEVNNWLNWGGDVRAVQTHLENKNIRQGRFFLMQADLAAAVTLKKWTGSFDIGQENTRDNTWRPVSQRYFLSYQFTDEFSVRAGKTIPEFGLQIPQHIFFIKDNLLLGEETERNNLEAFWIGEQWNVTASVAKSERQSKVRDEEKSVSAKVSRTFKDSHKISLSAWTGSADSFERTLYGLSGIFGWNEHFYTLAEVDQAETKSLPSNTMTKSTFELIKLGYEIRKGIHLQAVQQYGKPNQDLSSEAQAYGVGFLFYPRPHFEIEGLWQKQRTLGATDSDYFDYAYLLLHYYF